MSPGFDPRATAWSFDYFQMVGGVLVCHLQWEKCLAVPTIPNSFHMCCVELALKRVLCTRIGSKGQTGYGFQGECSSSITSRGSGHPLSQWKGRVT